MEQMPQGPGRDFIFGDFYFSGDFECANLSKVHDVIPPGSHQTKGKVKHSSTFTLSQHHTIDYEFNLWTKPDCAGTQYENNNRTWFCFSIQGGEVGKKVQLSVMNLNRQFKLYNQGMQPVVKCVGDVLPGSKWERIRDKCSYRSEDNNTVVSWIHTVPHDERTTYYAFTYPYSYTDLQSFLEKLDETYSSSPSIYYCRELLTRSLDKLRLDLLTISSHENKTDVLEDRLSNLFPDTSTPRPHKFENKKVVFVSARVHPGETQSSFVLNGFISFILSNDPLAKKIRDAFVFKIIPMLNPDGVVRGHYRTDQRGCNLNRVYKDPSILFHPTIYAAKKIILYNHYGSNMESLMNTSDDLGVNTSNENLYSNPSLLDEDTCHSFSDAVNNKFEPATGVQSVSNKDRASLAEVDEPSASGWDCSSNISIESSGRIGPSFSEEIHEDFSNVSSTTNEAETGMTNLFGSLSPMKSSPDFFSASKDTGGILSHGTTSAFSHIKSSSPLDKNIFESRNIFSSKGGSPKLGTSMSTGGLKPPFQLSTHLTNSGIKSSTSSPSKRLMAAKVIERDSKSKLFMYIDLHGHASKRGIFMYGNWFSDTDLMVENMLYPKTLSMNCQNFDFGACNFTERNMYLKDRRDGMSKDGSGRVAVMRSTGLLRSYTLECNYNTGRMVNPVQSCPGRYTTNYLSSPPKYTPAVFEECGRKLGVSLYDLIESDDHEFPSLNLNSLRAQIHNHLVGSSNIQHFSPGSLHNKTSSNSSVFNSPLKSSFDETNHSADDKGQKIQASTSTNKIPFPKYKSIYKTNTSPSTLKKNSSSTSNSPKLPRLHYMDQSVDAENQEPVPTKSPKKLKKKDSSSGSGRTKSKSPKTKSLKKQQQPQTMSRSLFPGSEDPEESSRYAAGKEESVRNLTSKKHSLTSSIRLTQNLNFKVSIADTPNVPKVIKKIGRKQRMTKGPKKLKTNKMPLLDEDIGLEEGIAPLEEDSPSLIPQVLSPRSPLASVCEPQTSLHQSCSSAGIQPKSPPFAKSRKSSTSFATAKRPSAKHSTLKAKNVERLPTVLPGGPSCSFVPPRMKLLPKKLKKKECPPSSPTAPSLQWVITEPPIIKVADELEPAKPKIKKRKKVSRKSL